MEPGAKMGYAYSFLNKNKMLHATRQTGNETYLD